jgi:hypothetical protein
MPTHKDGYIGALLDNPEDMVERIAGADGPPTPLADELAKMGGSNPAIQKTVQSLREPERRMAETDRDFAEMRATLGKRSEFQRIERMSYDERREEVRRVRGY